MAPVETLGLSKSPAVAISRASGSDYSVDGVPSDRVAVAPERTGSSTDEVVRALTDLTVARGLTPGDPLPAEPELSRELGIGRNSLREAIRALRGIGVIEVRHGYGTFVGELSMSALTDELLFHSRVALTDGKEYLRHLFEVRESLEQGLLSSLISDRLAPDGDRLTAILERMDAEAQLGAIDPRTDQEFHEVPYEPLRNLVATSPIRQTQDAIAHRDPGTPGATGLDCQQDRVIPVGGEHGSHGVLVHPGHELPEDARLARDERTRRRLNMYGNPQDSIQERSAA